MDGRTEEGQSEDSADGFDSLGRAGKDETLHFGPALPEARAARSFQVPLAGD